MKRHRRRCCKGSHGVPLIDFPSQRKKAYYLRLGGCSRRPACHRHSPTSHTTTLLRDISRYPFYRRRAASFSRGVSAGFAAEDGFFRARRPLAACRQGRPYASAETSLLRASGVICHFSLQRPFVSSFRRPDGADLLLRGHFGARRSLPAIDRLDAIEADMLVFANAAIPYSPASGIDFLARRLAIRAAYFYHGTFTTTS